MASTFSDLLPLKKLATSEDDSQRAALRLFEAADVYASQLLIGGPLLDDNAAHVRLVETLDRLAGVEACECNGVYVRECHAYRVGLMTGLRLSQAMDARPTPATVPYGTGPKRDGGVK